MNKGFRWIKFLIVIIIIGILAGVVLVLFGGNSDSAKDNAVKIELSELQPLSVSLSTRGPFDGYRFCDGATGHYSQVGTINDSINAKLTAPNAFACSGEPAGKWAAIAVLNDTNNVWCVDSTGFSGNISTITTTANPTTAQRRVTVIAAVPRVTDNSNLSVQKFTCRN